MSEKDNLWEGISIMSPQEMEQGYSEPETSTESKEEVPTEEKKEDDGLTISPVSTDTEVIDNNEEPSIETTSSETIEEDRQVSLNKYSALIKDMINDGVLTGPEGDELEELLKDASTDTIKNLMTHTVEKAFKAKESNWKNSFSGAKKKFLEIEDAFSDADTAIQMAQRLEFFEGVSEADLKEDTNLQKQMYFEYLKSKNFSDADAYEAIEDADAVNKLEEKALRALPELRKEAQGYVEQSRQEKRAYQEKLQKDYEENYKRLMSTIDEKDEFVSGLKLNKISRDKIKANITTPVYKDPKSGQEYTSLMYKQMRNPNEFQMLINYYDSIGLFNLDKEGKFNPDISKLKNVAKTKAVSELDRVLARDNELGTGRGNSNPASQTTQSALDLLEAAYKRRR
jgi:hypothetical protein